MAIGPFLPRMDQFDDVYGYNLNWVVDFINNFIDYSGVFSLGPVNGHLAVTGTVPTLGSLQPGVASQGIVGNDTCHVVTITTNNSPVAVGGQVFVVTYANAWSVAPVLSIMVNSGAPAWQVANPSSTTGYTVVHGGTNAGVSALAANSTYKYGVIAMGPGGG